MVELKKDEGKLMWSLIPFKCMASVIRVLMFGAKKYSAFAWMEGEYEDARARYFNAACRHIIDEWWEKGELYDDESGEFHLAHGVCCLIFLMWYDIKYKLNH